MGMDDKIHLRPQPVGVGVNALLTGRLSLSLPGAVLDPDLHQILRPHMFISHTAGRDDELAVRDPGTDISPCSGHQAGIQQTLRRFCHQSSGLCFRICHACFLLSRLRRADPAPVPACRKAPAARGRVPADPRIYTSIRPQFSNTLSNLSSTSSIISSV